MPNILTGNHASHSDFILSDNAIKQHKGLYCLNDLHKASGGNPKHRPSLFLRNKDTKELIKAIDEHYQPQSTNMCFDTQDQNTNLGFEIKSTAYEVIHGGNEQGVYACRELVYAYASWIDKRFYLLVLQTFDRVLNHFSTISDEVHALTRLSNQMRDNGSIAGFVLNKCKYKKTVDNALQKAIDKQQLKLALGE